MPAIYSRPEPMHNAAPRIRTLVLSMLATSCLLSCQSAKSIQLAESDATQSADSLVPETQLDSGVSDAIIYPQDWEADGSTCLETEHRECANGIDDDCDGRIDECDLGALCVSGECVSETRNGSCQDHLDCDAESMCLSGVCETIRLNACGDAGNCNGLSQCSTLAACGSGPACFGTWTAVCSEQCDCTSTLICSEASFKCVQCLHGGQCELDETCGTNGLCFKSLNVEPDTTAVELVQSIHSKLLECLTNATDKQAIGCLALQTSVVGPTEHSAVLDDLEAALTSCDELNDTKLRKLIGCDGHAGHLWVKTELHSENGPFACFSFLPYPPETSPHADSWVIAIDDCGSTMSN